MKLKRASLITKIIIIAAVVYAGLNLLSLKVQVSEAQEKRDILKTQAEDVMQTNTELSYAIRYCQRQAWACSPRRKDFLRHKRLNLLYNRQSPARPKTNKQEENTLICSRQWEKFLKER